MSPSNFAILVESKESKITSFKLGALERERVCRRLCENSSQFAAVYIPLVAETIAAFESCSVGQV
jgi:hypothetical protein